METQIKVSIICHFSTVIQRATQMKDKIAKIVSDLYTDCTNLDSERSI